MSAWSRRGLVIFAVGVAALLNGAVTHSAAAQSLGNCSAFEAAPGVPNGTTASHGVMTRSSEAIETWRQQRERKLSACHADIESLRAQLNAMEQAYNQAGTERNSVVAAWNAAVADYDARRGGSARRN